MLFIKFDIYYFILLLYLLNLIFIIIICIYLKSGKVIIDKKKQFFLLIKLNKLKILYYHYYLITIYIKAIYNGNKSKKTTHFTPLLYQQDKVLLQYLKINIKSRKSSLDLKKPTMPIK